MLRFERAGFCRALALTYQTHDECQEVEDLRGKTAHVPNGIDTDFYTPSPVGWEQWVLSVEQLVDGQKRVSDSIRVLRLLS